MLIKNNNSAILNLFNVTIILGLSSCTVIDQKVNNQPFAKYQYPHQCTKNGQLVNHSITAKVPLTPEELNMLQVTLQENMGLDYGSCVYIAPTN